MERKTIKKEVDIKASRERVWDVLLKDEFTRDWYEEFSPGSRAETDWQLGSKAVFKDQSGSGLIAKVVVNRPNEVVSIEYTGIIGSGKEDYESRHAQLYKGGRETYRLSDKKGYTHLAIESDMPQDMYDMMSEAWENALLKLKKLAEN